MTERVTSRPCERSQVAGSANAPPCQRPKDTKRHGSRRVGMPEPRGGGTGARGRKSPAMRGFPKCAREDSPGRTRSPPLLRRPGQQAALTGGRRRCVKALIGPRSPAADGGAREQQRGSADANRCSAERARRGRLRLAAAEPHSCPNTGRAPSGCSVAPASGIPGQTQRWSGGRRRRCGQPDGTVGARPSRAAPRLSGQVLTIRFRSSSAP